MLIKKERLGNMIYEPKNTASSSTHKIFIIVCLSFDILVFFSSREGHRLQTEDNAHELNIQKDLKRPLTAREEARSLG
jgi:hypothetical protein